MSGPSYASVLVTIFALASVASADARPSRGAVVVAGTFNAHARTVVAETVTPIVEERLWSVAPPYSAEDIAKILACVGADNPWPCLATNGVTRDVGRMLIVTANDDKATSQTVIVAEVVVAGLQVPSIERETCTKCTDDELASISRQLTKRLLDNIASRTSGSSISVTTVPPHASVTIDGHMVGESDSSFPVSAGPHTVRVQLAGYEPVTQQVTTASNQPVTLAFALDAEHHSRFPSAVPASLMIGGVVAVSAGAYLSLADDGIHTGKVNHYRYSAVGIAVAGVGVAAIAVGAYLWLRPSSRSAPVVALAPSGGWVGWGTSF